MRASASSRLPADPFVALLRGARGMERKAGQGVAVGLRRRVYPAAMALLGGGARGRRSHGAVTPAGPLSWCSKSTRVNVRPERVLEVGSWSADRPPLPGQVPYRILYVVSTIVRDLLHNIDSCQDDRPCCVPVLVARGARTHCCVVPRWYTTNTVLHH